MNNCIRYLHVVINILFMITGLLLVGFGLYMRFASGTQELLSQVGANTAVIYGSISIGSCLLLTGTCGALGIFYRNEALLSIYLSINVLFVMAEVGVFTFVAIERNSLDAYLKPIWNDFDNETKYLLQDRFNCCGFSNPNEWGNPNEYPRSCFNASVTTEERLIWSKTCYNAIVSFIESNVIIAAIVMGITLVLQVFVIVISCFLIRDSKPGNRRRIQNQHASMTT